MTEVTIPIPQTLYDRIALRGEELGMTAEQLAGLWLWQIEREQRVYGDGKPEPRAAISRDDEDLSAGKND